ncbi:hypothetical protein KIPB_006614 [Kipferlia bialata]|uniref:Uncharacterized protein n=1 Tax=Kipferlia bialata TaxID=797122 RepID=A0A9K3CYU1_9EUKA|nr:hypothetical protein KIPB_006614 [Kipferlia bialata]|eukprot:g6614.t1
MVVWVTTGCITFRAWEVGRTYSIPLKLRNCGTGVLTATHSIENGNLGFGVPFSEPMVLPTGIEREIQVNFTPLQAVAVSTRLRITLQPLGESFLSSAA